MSQAESGNLFQRRIHGRKKESREWTNVMRRAKFLVRNGRFNTNHRRLFHEIFIMLLALFAFMVVFYLTPFLYHRKSSVIQDLFDFGVFHNRQKGDSTAILKEVVVRLRTRQRRFLKSGDGTPYTGHSPYVTDDITNLVFDAEACPGSPPVPLMTPINKSYPHGQMPAHQPISYVNLIHRQKHGNDRGENSSQEEERHPPDGQDYDALFIVCSDVRKAINRQYLRQIYGNTSNTWPFKIKVVFLLGRPNASEVFENVTKEAREFSDIVMGNFLDHYDNLTYKTIIGYRWIHAHCRNVELVLKLDDDVFVDVYKFFDYFRPLIRRQTRTIHCFLNKSPIVHRVGKYQVSKEEFDGKKYMPFCSGFFIVPTPDIVDSYVSLYKDIRFFRLEDVFSYGMVRQAMIDVQLIHVDLVTVETDEYINCILRYKYQCKYLAAQVEPYRLPLLLKQMAGFRDDLGLNGTQSGVEDLF